MTVNDQLILVDKPLGWTSSDCVQYLKRKFRWKKAGHAGTLDPMATGVLVILVNNATKQFAKFQAFPKTYHAKFLIGVSTDTQDLSGRVQSFNAIDKRPLEVEIRSALQTFTGTIQQKPPIYSALKVKGKPAYFYAREGEIPELLPREVNVYAMSLLKYEFPEIEIEISVSTGFYVRSLCHDLGEMLGTGAVMFYLQRMSIGTYHQKKCQTIEAFKHDEEPVYYSI